MSAAGIFSSYADYALPNGRYLSDSRMQDMGGKFKLGYNSGKWNLELNYLYSNSRVGIPGHTHDVDPERGIIHDRLPRQKEIIAVPKNTESFRKHQDQLLHQFKA